MRELDLSPLYHSTVGFDSLVSVFDQIAGFQNEATTYPPYNIERPAENSTALQWRSPVSTSTTSRSR